MHTLRIAIASVLLLLVAPLARAEPPGPFLRLARSYRPEEHHRLPALRARLAVEVPDLFGHPLPACPLRSALAKAMTPDEARTLLSGSDPRADALAVVVDNLSARRDLPELILETGAYARLERGHARLLCGVAAHALLDGDDRMVRRLFSGPGWRLAAEELSRLAHPEGLRALADVVTGVLAIPPLARARLALYEPDVQNDRPVRPLGPERVEALGIVAARDPDPALRALAARILLRANDPAHATATVRGFVAARSVHLGSIDWHHLAKLAPTPVTDPRVSIEHRLDVLESWLVWTWIRAEQEPWSAEAHAATLRPVLRDAGQRLRGEAILMLADHVGVFVTTTSTRKRAVPSFLGILDDLEAGRPSDARPLTALANEVAARIRAELAEESGYPTVRIPDRPFDAESAWRPCDRTVDTALAEALTGIDSVDRFAAALARVEDVELPPDARLRVFERLAAIATEGGPDQPQEEDAPFGRRCFDRLCAWLRERAPGLDGGLAEVILGSLQSTYVPEELESMLLDTVHEAIDRVPPGGPRMRLEASRETR